MSIRFVPFYPDLGPCCISTLIRVKALKYFSNNFLEFVKIFETAILLYDIEKKEE
jgi:hypothetical protein